ncbi:hypothetical protein [Lentilactobacillus hilgardii]|uniref:Uncharacterized protein n=1 Tax=Lentilactobacillus hilgardii TaxID=1588 RepID=A0A6P1E9S1_LENHI|nr:hypothetical protein [Lentilactobacillus hilgardii]EEI71611.1 hypothetical protein HMPREF0496_1125 [Lentilactobacillus hilgardii ATCC 27305]MCT3392918.1 hypothetical protein [Lentilactobacillus hilgardii]QHB51473.1 hypothetical protein GQR93_04210 [Lentilactobacillus hilgardii]RRG08869.1 MAG: hypothetical protein DUD35_10640 [Lactobacillus sp.]
MDPKQINEPSNIDERLTTNDLIKYRYETKGELINAQMDGRSIINPKDDPERIPDSGEYTAIVKIADQKRITPVLVKNSSKADANAVIYLNLRGFTKLPHYSPIPVTITWIKKL